MAAMAMSRGAVTTLLLRALRSTAAVPASSAGRIRNYGAAAAAEELENPSKAPVDVKLTKLLIDGEFVDAASGKTFPTIDPRSEQVIAHVAEGDVEDVNRAVRAARKAFDHGPWPKMPAHKRSEILHKYVSFPPLFFLDASLIHSKSNVECWVYICIYRS